MTPKWQKLASLAQKYAHSSFSSLVQSLLPRDTLLRTYFMQKPAFKVAFLNDKNTLPFCAVGSGWEWISEGLNQVRSLFKFTA